MAHSEQVIWGLGVKLWSGYRGTTKDSEGSQGFNKGEPLPLVEKPGEGEGSCLTSTPDRNCGLLYRDAARGQKLGEWIPQPHCPPTLQSPSGTSHWLNPAGNQTRESTDMFHKDLLLRAQHRVEEYRMDLKRKQKLSSPEAHHYDSGTVSWVSKMNITDLLDLLPAKWFGGFTGKLAS